MRAKDTGTELGKIPFDWNYGRIDEYYHIQQGKQVSKSNRIGKNQKPFLRTSNLLWGKIILDELDYLHFTEEEERRLTLEYNDLLVCEGGDIGRTAIWKNQMDCCYYQNHLHRLRRTNTKTEPEFILFWMQYAIKYSKLYFGRGNITTIPNLSKSRLAEFIIPIPPSSEQRKIAYILNTIQKSIEQQEKLIRTTTELKKALMQKLFTEGIKGEKQKQTEIGLVPESWEVVNIGDIIEQWFGGGTPSTKDSDLWIGKNQWITSKWLSEKIELLNGEKQISDEAIKKSATSIVPANSLIFATRVGVGKIGINKIDLAINQDLAGGRLKANYDPYFIAYQYQLGRIQVDLESYKRGATIRGITRENLKSIQVAVPSDIKEQKEVSDCISLINKKTNIVEKKRQSLITLFKTLLHELMTGQRRVHEIDFEKLDLYKTENVPLSLVAEKSM